MGSNDAQVWDKTWSGRGKITFDLNTRLIFVEAYFVNKGMKGDVGGGGSADYVYIFL